jgi:SAM-dependent methyltransferase
MNPEFEDKLRKAMVVLGRVTEAIIGKAKEAKSSVGHSKAVEPVLAIEGQLPMNKIRELISISSDRVVKPLVPNLVDKAALEICDGEAKVGAVMKEKGAALAVHVNIGGFGGHHGEARPSGVHAVRAAAKGIPFEDGFFDYAVADFASPSAGDFVKAVKELGRQVTLGGHAVIADFHPFGMYAKKGGKRLRPIESVVRGVEDYYRICREAGFVITHMREIFIDETLRTRFETVGEKTAFRVLKNSPFLIFLFVAKKGR